MDFTSASSSFLPSWSHAICFTASSSEADLPSWKYGAVSAMFLSDGTLNLNLSAASFVTASRPMSSVLAYGLTAPIFW